MKSDNLSIAQVMFTHSIRSLSVFLVLFFFAVTPVFAAPYFVFGQIFQVTPDTAADETIADEDLIGDARGYVTVKLFDSDTNVFLGQAIADQDGIFTVQYDQPTGSTPDVYFRVYQEVADPGTDQGRPASKLHIRATFLLPSPA